MGLMPGWAGLSSGTAMASWSLLPLSIPLLIFSGNSGFRGDILGIMGKEWGEREKKGRWRNLPFLLQEG